MIARVVAWTGRHPGFVLAAALLAVAGGEAARRSLARDAIPELANPQIVVVAEWMGHSASEVADAIAAPLTRALEGTPGSTAVRGASMSGMAYLDVVFAAGADIAAGRATIAARVASARTGLPDAVRILVGPEASSTGWVFQYALVAPSLARTMGARVDPSLRCPCSGCASFRTRCSGRRSPVSRASPRWHRWAAKSRSC